MGIFTELIWFTRKKYILLHLFFFLRKSSINIKNLKPLHGGKFSLRKINNVKNIFFSENIKRSLFSCITLKFIFLKEKNSEKCLIIIFISVC